MTPNYDDITLLLLAGGKGNRMDSRDKGLLELAGRPLTRHLLQRFSPLFQHVIISANRNLEAYQAFGHTVITDAEGDFKGPLAGILGALSQIHTHWLLILPCDMPLLPTELVERLWTAAISAQRPAAMVHDGEQPQPLCSLLSVQTRDNLRDYLDAGHRRSREWLQGLDPAIADCSDWPQLFVNINTPQDLAGLESQLADQH